MQFAAVFSDADTQESVFLQTGMPLLTRVLAGYNGCAFVYGQDNSGKTYTMLGTEEFPGFIPRMATALFAGLSNLGKAHGSSGARGEVWATYLQIYKEHYYDLLVEGNERPVIYSERRAIAIDASRPFKSPEPTVRLGHGGAVTLEDAVRIRIDSASALKVRTNRGFLEGTVTAV
jgi:hypothetical protein